MITTEQLLSAYTRGYFPMADDRESTEIHWYYPESRGVIPLDDFHVPKSLAKFLKKSPFTFTCDNAFPDVIKACAERGESTWINSEIEALYAQAHKDGFAHSVECWQDGILVGGLYGIALGGAFFGESMFSRVSNASRASLMHLVGLLKNAGYTLLDAQYVNEHLLQFGIQEIPRATYLKRLEIALEIMPKPCF